MMNTVKQEQEEYEKMLSLKDIKSILGVSYGILIGHIRAGELRAYRVTGEPVDTSEVNYGTYGLRVYPSDFRAFLESRFVK